MATRLAKRRARDPAGGSRRYRKVTYSLPELVARELDRRSVGSGRGKSGGKSRVVAEALAFYFAAQDRKALAVLYAEAADDPHFAADNEAVQKDFASLDQEMDGLSR